MKKQPGGATKMWDPKQKKYVPKVEEVQEKHFISKTSLIIKKGVVVGKVTDGPYRKPKEEKKGE